MLSSNLLQLVLVVLFQANPNGFNVSIKSQNVNVFFKNHVRDFPGAAVVKTLPANAGDTGSSPGLGRSHMLQSN